MKPLVIMIVACAFGATTLATAQRAQEPGGRSGRPAAIAQSPQPKTMSTIVQGVRRSAVYYPGNSRAERVPLVVVFHGHGQSGPIANKLFGIERAWPQAFVAYPNGIPGVTDSADEGGELPGWQKDPGQLEDRDLKFFDELLSLATGSFMIDTTRIYVAGFSNGARFTYLLWSERRERLAAVAAFSSQALTADLFARMKPLPAMVGHGLRDPRVHLNEAGASFTKIVGINKAIVDKAGRSARDVGIFRYPFEQGGAETVQWTHSGGHEVPRNPGDEIAAFFKRHQR